MKTFIYIIILLVIAISISIIYDTTRILNIHVSPSRPAERIGGDAHGMLWKLKNDQPVSLENAKNIRQYVDSRYDCSDFRLQSVLRMLYEYPDELGNEIAAEFRSMLLNFKYWMDEQGDDGMCYWSENHQILFAAAEYLAGQLYPTDIFSNNGMTGAEHMEKARERILTWLDYRWYFGFTEWYSNTYYVEDIAPLSILIDFAQDDEIAQKAKIIMDLLIYDLASQSWKGTFVSSSGRMYEKGKKSGERSSMRAVSEAIFGYNTDPGERRGMDLNFLYINNYQVPEVIRAIGRDESTVIIKASNGLDVDELGSLGLIGLETRQIMMQWGMEAFTHPAVFENSLNYVRENEMFSNEFLYEMKYLDYRLLRLLKPYKLINAMTSPQTNGTAIQRSNCYTYKTPYYSMYTAQDYHPGEYGDQHHVFGVNLDNSLSVFHTHPALLAGEKHPRGNSPTYWVGNGHLPHSVQEENINLSIYKLPENKAPLEYRLIDFTHLYFPIDRFDQVIVDSNYVFGRYGDTFLVFIGKNKLEYNEPEKDFIQHGKLTYWICEMGDAETETFDVFVKRIKGNPVIWVNDLLSYQSNGKTVSVQWQRDFMINSEDVYVDYPRFDAPWTYTERDPQEIRFEHKGHTLYLNFNKGIREFN